MRRLLMLALVLVLAQAGAASAAIDWAGNAYPNHGAAVTPTGDQFVVAQVYKGGVTDAAGAGPDLAATLWYTTDIAAQASVPMAYNTDIGNNDEYIGYIPQAALVGAAWVDVTVVFDDLSDASQYEITGDQLGNPPPLRYNVVDVTPVDVVVTFTICMDATTTAGPPCVIGGAAPIGNWGSGVMLNNVSGDIWSVDVTFPAGSNPNFEYKYRKDVCQTWEGTANRAATLPTDGSTALVLAVDTWEFAPLGCGLGNVLSEDKVVCLQVCMEGVDTAGGVCAIGNLDELGNWANGVGMTHLGGTLWQACIVFPAGSPYPINAEYKFRKDGCETWESVGNRTFAVDDAMASEVTLTSSWDDGPGTCDPVPGEPTSWGSLKGSYR